MNVRLIAKIGKISPREIVLRQFPITIGRRPNCGLTITSRRVSRRHCVLDVHEGLLTVRDLNSTNGVYVNGERIERFMMIKPNDQLEIGSACWEVVYEPSTPNTDDRPQGALASAVAVEPGIALTATGLRQSDPLLNLDAPLQVETASGEGHLEFDSMEDITLEDGEITWFEAEAENEHSPLAP